MADPELRARACEMRQQGLTLQEIGRHLKRSPERVRVLLDPSLRPKSNVFTTRQRDIDRRLHEIDACRLFADGYSYDRLSGLAECAPATVRRWLERQDVTAGARAQNRSAIKHEE
jgi:DNA-binding CsgD family transcriptional regulator